MTSWLRVYAEAAASENKTQGLISLAASRIDLAANAPNNPFQQNIIVTGPQIGATEVTESKNTQLRFVGGAIAQLGGDGYSRNRFQVVRNDRVLSPTSRSNLTNGTFNVLQDVQLSPYPFEFLDPQSPNIPLESSHRTTACKIAGPIPIRLPGSNPSVVLNLEWNTRGVQRQHRVLR